MKHTVTQVYYAIYVDDLKHCILPLFAHKGSVFMSDEWRLVILIMVHFHKINALKLVF